MAWPCGVCTTSGWNCTACRRSLDVLHGGHRRVGGGRRDRKPVGRRGDRVEVAHPHLLVGRLAAAEQHAGCGDSQLGAAVLAATGAGHLAAELLGDELGAVTDAEHRHVEVVDPGSIDGAPSTCTDFGPPLKMIPAGCRAGELGGA